MQYRYLSIISVVPTLLLLAVPYIVFGQPTYSVSPLVINTKVEARDIITKKITLTNTGAQPVTIYPSVNNISLKEGGTIEAFLPPVASDRTESLASWIEIRRGGIDLQPGEIETIDLILRINPEPKSGTYHALIGFGYGRNTDEAQTQIENGQAPSTIVTVTIEEKKNEFLKLSKFIVDKFITNTENQAAVYTFNNPGDETVIPTGEIILYDSTGKEVGVISVNADGVSIPPGGEHVFTASVPTQGLFGKYKAFLSVEYGSTQRGSVQDTSFFYVLPLKIILSVGLIVAIIVIFSALYVHRKYLDEAGDDSDQLTFHVRDTQSESKDHDLHLKPK